MILDLLTEGLLTFAGALLLRSAWNGLALARRLRGHRIEPIGSLSHPATCLIEGKLVPDEPPAAQRFVVERAVWARASGEAEYRLIGSSRRCPPVRLRDSSGERALDLGQAEVLAPVAAREMAPIEFAQEHPELMNELGLAQDAAGAVNMPARPEVALERLRILEQTIVLGERALVLGRVAGAADAYREAPEPEGGKVSVDLFFQPGSGRSLRDLQTLRGAVTTAALGVAFILHAVLMFLVGMSS